MPLAGPGPGRARRGTPGPGLRADRTTRNRTTRRARPKNRPSATASPTPPRQLRPPPWHRPRSGQSPATLTTSPPIPQSHVLSHQTLLPSQSTAHHLDLAIILLEPHHWDVLILGEPVDPPAKRRADLLHDRRRRNRQPQMRRHERHDLPTHLQVRQY